MDRRSLRNFTHKADSFLEISNDTYKQWVFRYTFLELEKDLGSSGDITTAAVFHQPKAVVASVIAKSSGVFAGRQEILYFLVDADKQFRPRLAGDFLVEFAIKDGEEFNSGDVLLTIKADVHDLLAVERVVLNLLTRMCSVATFTKSIVDSVSEFDVMISPTRKTLWGLLDKRAVFLGGGGTHRLNLGDAMMIKDNHLDLLGRDFERILENISFSKVHSRFIEIEVDSQNEALLASRLLSGYIAEKKIRSIGVILFDNMEPKEISSSLASIRRAGNFDDLLFEASGGIDDCNVFEFAETGVDIVSMGCLTGAVPTIDLTMEV